MELSETNLEIVDTVLNSLRKIDLKIQARKNSESGARLKIEYVDSLEESTTFDARLKITEELERYAYTYKARLVVQDSEDDDLFAYVLVFEQNFFEFYFNPLSGFMEYSFIDRHYIEREDPGRYDPSLDSESDSLPKVQTDVKPVETTVNISQAFIELHVQLVQEIDELNAKLANRKKKLDALEVLMQE